VGLCNRNDARNKTDPGEKHDIQATKKGKHRNGTKEKQASENKSALVGRCGRGNGFR